MCSNIAIRLYLIAVSAAAEGEHFYGGRKLLSASKTGMNIQINRQLRMRIQLVLAKRESAKLFTTVKH